MQGTSAEAVRENKKRRQLTVGCDDTGSENGRREALAELPLSFLLVLSAHLSGCGHVQFRCFVHCDEPLLHRLDAVRKFVTALVASLVSAIQALDVFLPCAQATCDRRFDLDQLRASFLEFGVKVLWVSFHTIARIGNQIAKRSGNVRIVEERQYSQKSMVCLAIALTGSGTALERRSCALPSSRSRTINRFKSAAISTCAHCRNSARFVFE